VLGCVGGPKWFHPFVMQDQETRKSKDRIHITSVFKYSLVAETRQESRTCNSPIASYPNKTQPKPNNQQAWAGDLATFRAIAAQLLWPSGGENKCEGSQLSGMT